MSGQRILRLESDGSLATHADLTCLSEAGWNEIVVDGRANAYVNAAVPQRRAMAIENAVPHSGAIQLASGTALGCSDHTSSHPE